MDLYITHTSYLTSFGRRNDFFVIFLWIIMNAIIYFDFYMDIVYILTMKNIAMICIHRLHSMRLLHFFLLEYVWFAVIPDSEGHTLTPTRTSCQRTVTPVILGSYPRLMHTRSLNKTFGIGRTTWDSFPEIIATHRRLPPRPRLTWPLNRSQKTRGLKQAVNSPKSVCVFRWWNNYKLQLQNWRFW